MSRAITLRSVALCDYISRLPDGKSDIIGAYSNVVTLGMRPSLLDATFIANFQAEEGEEAEIEFRVSAPRVAGSGLASISSDAVYFDIEAPIMGFVTEDGEITFEWRFPGLEWQAAARWLIKFKSDAIELDEEDTKKLRKLFSAKGEATDILMKARSNVVEKEELPIVNSVSDKG